MNDFLDSLPDYDVLKGGEVEPEKKKPRRRPNDYGDGFGEYYERKTRINNYVSVLFFPLLIIYLESVLRLSIGETFLSIGVIYTAFLTVPIACVLTVLCTFGSEALNRVLCNIFALLITLLFVAQILYQSVFNRLFTISGESRAPVFESVLKSLGDKAGFLIAAILPLVLSIIAGKYLFRFHKIRIPAKICLILVAVLFQLVSLTALSINRRSSSPVSSYNLYHHSLRINDAQERFGLLTAQRLDIQALFGGNNE